jgi:hypothetical protein
VTLQRFKQAEFDLDLDLAIAQAEADLQEPIEGLAIAGDCPYGPQCESRRLLLSTHRRYQICHWRIWQDWRRCPIFKNGHGG